MSSISLRCDLFAVFQAQHGSKGIIDFSYFGKVGRFVEINPNSEHAAFGATPKLNFTVTKFNGCAFISYCHAKIIHHARKKIKKKHEMPLRGQIRDSNR